MSNDETKHVTGYAPIGYPQPFPPPQQGCYGYPYTPYPNHYNAVVPPPGTACYSSAQLPNISTEPSKGFAYARVALIIMIVLMVCTLAFSIFTWLVFGSGVPEFKIESFNVPYFDITNSTLKASWESNMTVKNTNQRLKISFTYIEGSLLYRDKLVDVTMIDPLHLERNDEGRMKANFSLPDPEGIVSDANSLVNAMGEDRKIGIMEFDLRLFMGATFTSGSFWSKKVVLRVLCGDLRVNFPAPTGGGTWNGRRGQCLTYY